MYSVFNKTFVVPFPSHQKWTQIGLDRNIVTWIKIWLKEHKQRVSRGIAEGLLLQPLLFNSFINDLEREINSMLIKSAYYVQLCGWSIFQQQNMRTKYLGENRETKGIQLMFSLDKIYEPVENSVLTFFCFIIEDLNLLELWLQS